LIAFDATVKIHGDGRATQTESSSLSDMKYLLKKGEDLQRFSEVPVGKVGDDLLKVVRSLKAGSATALGPALAIAVGIGSKAPGSRIMVCTDGCANCGVGDVSRDADFYSQIAFRAKDKGISVSVLTMEGEDCSMENLGKTADITNGNVEIVNPVDLKSKVMNVFSREVIATKAQCTVTVPYVLLMRGEDKSGFFRTTRELASITGESDITFSVDWEDEHRRAASEYMLKKYDENRPPQPKYFDAVPIQVQLQYSNLEGDQLLHVLTVSRPVTCSRAEAEDDVESLNTTVVALQAIHESARIAQLGKYNDARINLVSVQRLLQRTMKEVKQQRDYLSYIVQAEKLDQFMREAKAQEQLGVKKDAKRDDEAAKAMYQMKSVSVSTFNNRR